MDQNMEIVSYKDFWNHQASSAQAAIAAVDGSQSEDVVQHTGRWSAAQVYAALDIGENDLVLELGCGVGRIGRELAPKCRHWTGVDISENMIEHAVERLAGCDNVSFHRLDRNSLAILEDNSFDKAYSIAVFCHMDKEDLFLYMQELNRVIRPGGTLFVETWNLSHPVGWRRWAYEPLVWSRADHSQRKDVARNQFCTADEFELYVTHAGFETLANFNASQSVQIIAGKKLEAGQKAAELARISANRDDIAYSALYAELFAQSVDVLFGKMPAGDMLEYIDELGDASEARLFRPYLLSLWKKNAEIWGMPPA
jgi:SAM-dependent methyltransferase